MAEPLLNSLQTRISLERAYSEYSWNFNTYMAPTADHRPIALLLVKITCITQYTLDTWVSDDRYLKHQPFSEFWQANGG